MPRLPQEAPLRMPDAVLKGSYAIEYKTVYGVSRSWFHKLRAQRRLRSCVPKGRRSVASTKGVLKSHLQRAFSDGKISRRSITRAQNVGRSGLRGSMRAWFRTIVPRWFPTVPRKPVFLSLFGGAGHCAAAACRMGLNALVVDLLGSVANDMVQRNAQVEVERFLLAFPVRGVGLDLCCTSWSRARRGPPGSNFPRQLRDDSAHLYIGMPGLAVDDKSLVDAENAMLEFSIRIIRICLKLGIRGYLENPRTSRLWLTGELRALIAEGAAFTAHACFCCYGASWMKPTTFLIWGVPAASIHFRVCYRKYCRRTGCRHQRITIDNSAAAQEYPVPLAEDLMRQLMA